MVAQAVIEKLQGATTPISSYDSTKINLGSLIVQNNSGSGPTDKWCGPVPPGIARPNQEAQAFSPGLVSAIRWGTSNKDWVFYVTGTAGNTFTIGMYEADRLSGAMTWKGFVTITPPPATSHTPRGLQAIVDTYSTGTVGVSGTAVTGSGTAWQTARFAVGARIGFGSTDPTQISTWYNISAIGSDTGITLATSAGTISAGTAFVIEELRFAFSTTNATTTNGGLFLAKGLNYSTFVSGGTTIPAATTTDNIQAVYWLADAATVTNTVAHGLAVAPKTNNTTHYCYVGDGSGTSLKIYKYNLRAALTLTSGKDTANGIVLSTGAQTVTGNITAQNNNVLATMSSGTGSGTESIYLITQSPRIYRVATANVTSGSTTFVSDNMSINAPANLLATTLPTAGLWGIAYDSITDRLIIGSASTTGSVPFLTPYDTVAAAIDFVFGTYDWQSISNTAPAGVSSHYRNEGATAVAGQLMSVSQGIFYTAVGTSSTSFGHITSIPIGAHWKYQSSSQTAGRLISPSITTSGASAFYRVFANDVSLIAPTPDNEISWNAEPYRIYARTSGISDNSGSWTLLNDSGDLSGFAGANAIQFMIEFRTCSKQCIPARIINLCVVYESSSYIPSWLEWNVNDSDVSNGTVGFTQVSTNGSVPTFTIEYYREDTNALVLTQASTGSTNGNFQYWNGSTWTNGTGTDTVGLRRRFVPSAGLPSGVNCYTKLITS